VIALLFALGPVFAAPVAQGAPGTVAVSPAPIPSTAARTSRLVDLPMITPALEAIAAEYVDPSRIDPERMLAGALEGAERVVPRLLAVREATGWRLRVGRRSFDLPGAPMRRLDALRPRLVAVAALLERELGDADIVASDPMLTPDQNLEFAMLEGLMKTLDPHSGVVSPSRRFADDPREGDPAARFGVSLVAGPQGWVVDAVVPGRSAFAAGVRPGSLLVAVDGEAVGRWDRAALEERLVTPLGSPSRWTLSDGSVRRDVFVLPQTEVARGVDVRRDGRHLVMTLPRFTDGCAAELLRRATALGGVTSGGGVVLDLRGNPGGLVRQAAEVADLFLADGDILGSQRAQDARPQLSRAKPASGDAAGLEAAPLVVLVDSASASASEIVAAALSVRDRALLVGEPTFGKGTIQAVSGLPSGVRMKLTVAHDVAPSGDSPVGASVQRVGVTPDVLLAPARLEGGLRLMAGASATRERDLPGALPALGELATAASFAITPPSDPLRDEPLSLAFGLLDRGGVLRRTAWLDAASLWLASRATDAEAALRRALGDRGIDWRAGAEPLAHPEIEVALDVEGGELVPGGSREVRLTVTNRGSEALHRLVGVDVSDGPTRGTEFVFGHVPPGASRTATVSVALAADVADRVLRPSVLWHAPLGVPLGATDLAWPVAPDVRATLAWHAERQSTPQGWQVAVAVRNDGSTALDGATLWLRSASGVLVDVDAAHAALPLLRPGEEARQMFVVGGDPTGSFHVGLDRGLLPGPPLALADDAGFGVWHANPIVRWSESEERRQGASHVPFSGTVSDADGIARWAFFLDGDKVAMAEGGGARAVPFYADAFLAPGRHEARLVVWDTVGAVTEAREVVLGPAASGRGLR
jgi:carboxyl-terminal processing protease